MKSTTRLLLTLLLAITLPFHAAVGVAMMQSVAFDGGEQVRGAGMERSTHVAHGGGPAVHEPGVAHDAHSGHVHHATGDDSSSAESQGNHCGTCTVCCTSVGLTGMALVVPEPGAFDERILLAEQPLTSIPPTRLDRPPLRL